MLEDRRGIQVDFATSLDIRARDSIYYEFVCAGVHNVETIGIRLPRDCDVAFHGIGEECSIYIG